MIAHERIKTNIFATAFGLSLGIVYLYFYINGYFGETIFGWEFLSGLLNSFIHPVALIGLIPFLIVAYIKKRKNSVLGFQNIRSAIKVHSVILIASTVLIVSIYIIEKETALVSAFIYFFILGFFSSYLLGMRIFEIKNED